MENEPDPIEEWEATDPPWWVLYPWADSIEEVWDEIDDEGISPLYSD